MVLKVNIPTVVAVGKVEIITPPTATAHVFHVNVVIVVVVADCFTFFFDDPFQLSAHLL